MERLSKFWTGAVAYVSLLVGAGLSMAGNLADTYRTRGHDVDSLDKILAISWPALVILAIEMFVSPRWKHSAMFQVWRWVGCLAIGGMAMVASWTHLHDLLATRGQLAIVAILGPLAIDGMAIMATGLILSTRGHVATASVVTPLTGHEDGFFGQPTTSGHDLMATLATQPDDPTVDISDALNRWEAGYQEAIDDLGQDVVKEAESILSGGTTVKSPPVIPGEIRVPEEARPIIAAMIRSDATPKEIDEAIMEMCNVSTRTARRYRAQVKKELDSAQG